MGSRERHLLNYEQCCCKALATTSLVTLTHVVLPITVNHAAGLGRGLWANGPLPCCRAVSITCHSRIPLSTNCEPVPHSMSLSPGICATCI